MPEETPERPGQLISSTHVHVIPRDQQKPMLKLMSRFNKMKHPGKPAKPPARSNSHRKGLQANQNVAIKHKQIFW